LLIDTSATADTSIEDLLDLLRFALMCERGKIAIGEGNNSIGDLLPGYLAEHSLTDIKTFISDKAAMLLPPYESEEQQVLRDHAIREAAQDTWGWDREDARRYFIAGGGSAPEFELAWQRRLEENRQKAIAVNDGSFYSAGGNILYAVSGRKPTGPG
jgi:hypothetical protein